MDRLVNGVRACMQAGQRGRRAACRPPPRHRPGTVRRRSLCVPVRRADPWRHRTAVARVPQSCRGGRRSNQTLVFSCSCRPDAAFRPRSDYHYREFGRRRPNFRRTWTEQAPPWVILDSSRPPVIQVAWARTPPIAAGPPCPIRRRRLNGQQSSAARRKHRSRRPTWSPANVHSCSAWTTRMLPAGRSFPVCMLIRRSRQRRGSPTSKRARRR